MRTDGWVLAVDPGKKTGMSFWRVNNDDEPPVVNELSWPDFGDYVEDLAAKYGELMDIVCESFTITVQTAKNTQAPWSLEGIGVCRHLVHKYGCNPDKGLVLQAPSTAKTFSSDQRLKELGWWARGLGHGNDASRHLLVYAAQRGWWSNRIAL